ncbi:molybdopterin molybdotransferase MoeA [Krasilnikoviella flava]|uniref:Molybdopterin molybdenumtransferase n=1 Tax=Krasilnikoviella flava TaxID=526729 RepID=A0A1T5I6Z0_9MICO|nr:gephyrin-like molybdotransferase Glp [Krasilnikoviella flava]SKC34956.1 molybdopterin molybdotransferase [Krasilnikoviella flava]
MSAESTTPGSTPGSTRSLTEHVAAVLARVAALPAEDVGLDELAVEGPGRVLGADVRAVALVPPFDAAAMDGYAVRLADLPADGSPATLPVVGDLRPGSPPDRRRRAAGAGHAVVEGRPPAHHATGAAVRIMTGAPVPGWADAVVPVERTSTGRFVAGGPTTEREVTLARQPRGHVRHRGEDVRPGDLLGRAGDAVTPALVAVAASAGLTALPVRRRPRVAVLSTGSELVPARVGSSSPVRHDGLPDEGRAADPTGLIPDSNSLLLAALARAAGADVVRVGAVPDDADALRAALDRVAAGPGVDLLVTTGGVSAGASDVVRAVLDGDDVRLADVEVAAVALRPGRPQALARWRGVPWVALPGNPVSAFVSFALFVRPAVAVLAGREPVRPVRRTVAEAWPSPPGRTHVVPVRSLPSGVVERAVSPGAVRGEGPGSGAAGHATSALLGADALALVHPDVDKVEAGDEVDVLPLDLPFGAGA